MLRAARICVCWSVVIGAGVCIPPLASAQTPVEPPATAAVTPPSPNDPDIATPTPSFARPSVLNDLFGGAVRDFRRLPSKQTATWIVIGAAAAEATHTADSFSTSRLTRSTATSGPFGPGNTLGGAPAQLAGSLGTYAIGRFTGNGKITEVGADLFRAQMITQAITQGLKFSVRRVRPDGTPYSFPSGHTSTSFASATVLQRQFGWKVGVPAYGLATYVAASRVETRRHFLSDVAFGAALGVLVGRTVTVGHGDARFAVAPLATPGGGGVSFTLIGSR